MKLQVKVKLRSKIEKVEVDAAGVYLVSVNAQPLEGAANERVIELIAAHFKVPKSRVAILRGLKSKLKTVEVALP